MIISFESGKDLNPRQSSGSRELYDSAKELRIAARQKEKHGDISSAVLDQWKMVHQQLLQLFNLGCADLELCSWLAETTLRLEGFAGLQETFFFIGQLIEKYGTELSSIELATEMPQYWMAPIAVLSGEGREGVLIQPLRLCALVPQQKYGSQSLWHYQSNIQDRQSEAFRSLSQSVHDAGLDAMRQQRDIILTCITDYRALIAKFEALFPNNSPASVNILNVLHECVYAINDLTGFKEVLEQNTSDISEESDLTLSHSPADSTYITITDREQALQLLSDVALFFRRYEPQSPLAPALETLIRRGRLPFAALLEDLLVDDGVCRTILATAGIQSPTFENH